MKISTIILSIIVLAGCASMGYNFLSVSNKVQKPAPVIETARSPVPVAPAPSPPPPPVAASRPPAYAAGSSSGSSIDRLMISPPGAGVREPSGSGRPPSARVLEGSRVNVFSTQTFNVSMAFAMRDKANIDEDIKAQLLIDPRKDLEQLEKELSVNGNKFSKNIKVTKIVRATLTAPDFDVKNITEEEQFITSDQSTEWLWTLSPKSTGVYEVNLSITAILNVDGRESKHHLKTFERTITVEITHQQIISKWWSENWKWVTSTIVIPLLIFLLKDWVLGLLNRKKKKS